MIRRVHTVARIIRLIAGVLAAIIGLGILFVVLGANKDNSIVSFVLDLARGLVGPFDGIFELKKRKFEVAVNWGIALVVYLVVGNFLAGLVARAGSRRRDKGED